MAIGAPRIWRPQRFRQALADAGLSQGELGRRIGAHPTSVSDWARNRNAPSGRHLAGIARETGKSPEYFYGDDDEESEPAVRALTLDEIVLQRAELAVATALAKAGVTA